MKKLFLSFLLISSFLLLTSLVLAQGDPLPGGGDPKTSTQTQSAPIVRLDNPLGSDVTIPGLIGRVISAILGIVGSLALVMFIYGGFTWMLAAGNNEKVKKGKDILVWAAIGLIVIFSSYALVRFVIESIGST